MINQEGNYLKHGNEAEPDGYRTVHSQSKAHKSLYFPYPQSERTSETASQSIAASYSTYFQNFEFSTIGNSKAQKLIRGN